MIKHIEGEKISLGYNPDVQEFTIYKDFNGFREEFTMLLKDARQMREMFDFIWSANDLWKYDSNGELIGPLTTPAVSE